MKLVYPHDVPRLGVVRTFRHSRLAPLLTFAFVAGGTAWWAITMTFSDRAEWIHWLPTLLGLVMCFVILIYLRKSLKATNWLLRITEDGVYIKFRSYLNDRLPETGPTILHVPYAEIERIQPGLRTVTLPDRDGRVMTSQLRFMDIALGHEATAELANALKTERSLPPIRNGAPKHHDYPLRVTAPNRLRLEWKVRPALRTAIETLQRFAPVDHDPIRARLDWNKMDDQAKADMIVELAELGERMRARHLAQEFYNLEKDDAKIYINEIVGRDD